MNMLTHLNGLLQTNGGSMADLNSYTLLQQRDTRRYDRAHRHIAAVVIGLGTAAYWASRYKKCPSNKILVVYGKVAVASLPRLCTVVVLSSGRSFNLTSTCRLSPYS